LGPTSGLLALFFCFGLNDVIRLPTFSVALFCSVLSEIEETIAFRLFAAPAQNDVCSETKKLASYFDEKREEKKQLN
jgi:hypothetical protein